MGIIVLNVVLPNFRKFACFVSSFKDITIIIHTVVLSTCSITLPDLSVSVTLLYTHIWLASNVVIVAKCCKWRR